MNHRLLHDIGIAAATMMAISSSLSAAGETKPAIDLGAPLSVHAVLQRHAQSHLT